MCERLLNLDCWCGSVPNVGGMRDGAAPLSEKLKTFGTGESLTLAESATQQRLYLTRKEAADYLTRNYFRISVGTLNRYASNQEGPRFTYLNGGGPCLYRRDWLDTWARSFEPAGGEEPPTPPSSPLVAGIRR